MNTCLKASKKDLISGKTVLRILVIAIISLVGLLVLDSQQAQAKPPVCEPGCLCAPPEEDLPHPLDPQLRVVETTHAYTGPGYNYLNYGDLMVGYSSQVTGISEDGRWLVIPFPRSIAPDGQAWVDSNDVRRKNIRVLPDWLANCDGSPMTYCGYVLSQSAFSHQLRPDWLADCDPDSMTYCAYVLANSPQFITVKKPSARAVKFAFE